MQLLFGGPKVTNRQLLTSGSGAVSRNMDANCEWQKQNKNCMGIPAGRLRTELWSLYRPTHDP